MRTRLVGIVLGVMFVAGCSGAATPGPTASGAIAPTQGATTEPTGEPTGEASFDGGGNPFDCAGLAGSIDAGSNPDPGPGASFDPDLIANSLRQYAASGPAEIRDDLLTLADAWATYVKVLSDAGIDLNDPTSFANLDQAQLAKFAEAAAAIDSAEVVQASANVEAYIAANCG